MCSSDLLKQSVLMWLAPLAALVLSAGSFIPALRKPLAPRRTKPMHETTAFRWSRVVQRRPWVSLVVGTGALLAITLPVLDLRLGFADEGNYPSDTTTKRAYDLLAEGFGPGFNGPLTLVAAIDTPEQLASAQSVSQALVATPGVAFA